MLSAYPIKNTAEASDYFFKQDNYYLSETTEGQHFSLWWGKGADTLGLKGQVTAQQFTDMLNGKLPTGQQLGKKVGDEIQHRPGYDLTFSAPKSLSILAEAGGDERLWTAHQKAVEKTLTYIEQQYALARITVNKQTRSEKTGNLVVARFQHDISRSLDPHTHTHCVVMNATQREDGNWRALASNPLGKKSTKMPEFFGQILKDERFLGSIYRINLAYELTQLGYTIRQTHKDGRFEIEGVPQEVIDHFSKSRQKIEAFLEENNLSGARASSFAALQVRDRKKITDRAILRETWKKEFADLNFDPQSYVATHKEKMNEPVQENSTPSQTEKTKLLTSIKAVEYAIEHLSERDTTLSHERLLQTAFSQTHGSVTATDILRAVEHAVAHKKLIPLEGVKLNNRYTTPTLLRYEQDCLDMAARNIYSVMPVLPDNKRVELSSTILTEKQKIAVTKLLQSHDRYTALVGISGTGKTAMIPTIADVAKQQGFKPLVLTPSSAAAKSLEKQNVTAETLSSFLKKIERATNRHELKQQQQLVLILDDTQIVCSRQVCELMSVTEKLNARLKFIGDPKAYLPIEGGNPLDQLLRAGLSHTTLTTLMRQKDERTHAAIHNTLAGDISAAFEKVGDRIKAVEKNDDRFSAMAKHYVMLSDALRDNTMVLMPSRAECDDMNDRIRAGLKSWNRLEKVGIAVDTLVPYPTSTAQMTSAQHYRKDLCVRFNQNQSKLGIKAGSYFTVISNDPINNHVLLKNSKGKEITWNPKLGGQRTGGVEVFQKKTLEVCIGDRLRWSRNHAKQGIFSGEALTVIGIKDQYLTVARQTGKAITLNLREHASTHFSYRYAVTPYQTYHEEVQQTIAHHHSQSGVTHQRAFYKAISQAKEAAWIYTDAREPYLQTLERCSGQRMNALEAVLQDTRTSESAPEKKTLQEYAKYTHKAWEQLLSLPPNQFLAEGKTPEELANITVRYAIAHLSEREATFTYQELLKTIMETKAFGQVNTDHIEAELKKSLQAGDLIAGDMYLTTRETLETEKRILALAHASRDTRTPIASPEVATAFLKDAPLNAGQRDAISRIIQSKDSLVLVQGYAGVGKTHMLSALKTIAEQQGYTILGLAPTHPAVRELNAVGIKAQTLQSFLFQYEGLLRHGGTLPDYSRTLFILDEASMVSNAAKLPLFECIQKTGSQLTEVGDQDQLKSPEAGSPFTWLQKTGVSVAVMDKIQRQADSPVLLEAVHHIIKKDFNAAFETLDKQTSPTIKTLGIIEPEPENNPPPGKGKKAPADPAKKPLTPLAKLAQDFLARTPEEQANTAVIIPRNEDRATENKFIRAGLQEKGTLHGAQKTLTIFVPRHFTHPQSQRADQYEKGNVVLFNSGIRALGITKGQYLTVESVDKQYNILSLRTEKGELCAWQPAQGNRRRGSVEVYQAAERDVQVGDRIRWTRSDKKNIVASDLATVVDVSEKTISVQLRDGTIQSMETAHFDHAYAATGHAWQGKTKQHSMTYQTSYGKNITTQSGAYVAVSRAKETAVVYTEDREKLLERLAENTGEKRSALELVNHPLENPSDAKAPTTTAEISPKPAPRPPTSPAHTNPTTPRWDAKDIAQRLADNAEHMVERLLGKPLKVTPTSYQYGSHQGSLTVTLKGDKRGLWYDFQTGEGGHLLSLVGKSYGHHLKQDFHKTLAAAAELLGLSPSQATSAPPVSPKPKVPPTPETLTDYQKNQVARARRLEKESVPATGTLAERYLREHRGIRGTLPASIRFHPKIYSHRNGGSHPALLVIAKGRDGKTQSVQATFLNSATAQKADVPVKKQTFGSIKGALLTLQEGKPTERTTLIAEGVETGLSVREAFPDRHIAVTLGASNYRHIDPEKVGDKVIFCLDNDGADSPSQKTAQMAAERLQQLGKEVWVNQPRLIEDKKTDYNDVLKVQGVQTVKEQIDQSAPFHPSVTTPIPSPQDIQKAIDRFGSPVKSPAHTPQTHPTRSPEMTPREMTHASSQPKNQPVKQREIEREL